MLNLLLVRLKTAVALSDYDSECLPLPSKGVRLGIGSEKPQNLVMMGPFPDCDIKLCDFEISRVILEGAEVREILGTPDYVAPEIIHYEPITLAADMWSLGVTVYVLLTGFSPFGGETDQETFCNISRCELDFPPELFEDVSPEAKDFVARLLVRKPSARMTSKECLRHPWLARKSRTQKSNIGGSIATGINSRRSESPVLAACAGGSGTSQKNLRKYLSKSREALFERVTSSNRKTLSKSRERLFESHMSLVSKSRERLLMLEPSSRSIEKLYGLRSLSKSQDALSISAQEMLATNPVLAAQHMLRCQSVATSLGRDTDRELLALNTTVNEMGLTTSTISRDRTISESNLISLPTKSSIVTSETTVKVDYVAPPAKTKITTPKSENSHPKITKSSTYSETKNLKNNTSTLNTPPSIKKDKTLKTDRSSSRSPKISRKSLLDAAVKTKDENKENHVKSKEITKPTSNETAAVSLAQLGVNGEESTELTVNNQKGKNEETESDTSEKTIRVKSPSSMSGEEDEPRYSVAQLVSAYNKNDQVAATSAMTYDKTVPSKLKCDSRFPTGAHALRLFIPDIMISDRKQQSASPGVNTFTDPLSDVKECTTSPESSLSPAPSVEEHKVEESNNNNNNTKCHTSCQFLTVPQEVVALARSGSLSSSEASGYDTLSGASSLISLEENNSPPLSLSASQSSVKTEHKIHQRPRSSSLHTESLRPPWGTVCTGSYSRAMDRFHNKNNLIQQPSSQRQRRKSSPIIKPSMSTSS